MTEETKFKKALMLVGETDSGKSLVASLLELLIGTELFVGLDIDGMFKGENSLEPMLGKRVGCIGDLRLKEAKFYGARIDRAGMDKRVVSFILKVTGRDKVTIPRKYIGAWEGRLPMKFILISNEDPNLNDDVLPKRFIKLWFGETIPEEEQDKELIKKFEAERPGIAWRCVQAFQRLLARDRFIQPESGLELAEDVAAKSQGADLFDQFVEDCIAWQRYAGVVKEDVRSRFKDWCKDNGWAEGMLMSAPGLSSKLKSYAMKRGLYFKDPPRRHGTKRAFGGLCLKRERW
jgi:putative DNA primase/helicase